MQHVRATDANIAGNRQVGLNSRDTLLTEAGRGIALSETELGAKSVGIVPSLMAACRNYYIDAYNYLLGDLQRVVTDPAARLSELTPRLWKWHFSATPLRFDLYSHR